MANDLFMDSERLKKMIALGIYDDKTVEKMKDMKNSDFKDRANTYTIPTMDANQPSSRLSHPKPINNDFRQLRPQLSDKWRPNPRGRGGFRPIANSSYKWSEVKTTDANPQTIPKRPYPKEDGFREGFRSGIRDGIQTKIQRNEIETKLNHELINERHFGNNSCADRDFRPKSDTDSRLRDTDSRIRDTDSRNRDTDFRPINKTNTSKNHHNLHPITSTAIDEDLRRDSGGDGQRREQMRGNEMSFDGDLDDINDFIAKTQMKLNLKPQQRGGHSGRGRGGVAPNVSQRPDNSYNQSHYRSTESQNTFTKRLPNDSYDRRREELEERDRDSEADPTKHIAILKETVEELAKSDLFCQYCLCHLGSLNDVNSHIETPLHQQNMAEEMMKDKTNAEALYERQVTSGPQPQRTVIERMPTGMAALVKMIEQRKQITLQSLTEMEDYEIMTDNEASLAKALAKLLTNELLQYKMQLMPENCKEILKDQGIGLMGDFMNV